MPSWLFKTLLTLALLVLDVTIVTQIYNYWAGMAYFPLASTFTVAAFHLAVLLVLVTAHVKLIQYKKA